MYIVHVFVRVKKENVVEFREATLENARNSVLEPGVGRFDVVQDLEDSTQFVLVEAYKTAEDAVAHKETVHYEKWRDTVEPMMAEPRRSVKYGNCFPDDIAWVTPQS